MKSLSVLLVVAALAGCDSVDFRLDIPVDGKTFTQIFPTILECAEQVKYLRQEVEGVGKLTCKPVPSNSFIDTLDNTVTILDAYKRD